MSFSSGTSTNVLLLFDNNNDIVQAWMDYIEESLKASLTVDSKDLNTCLAEVSSSYTDYKVIVVLLSPETTDILSASSAKWERCFARHGNVVALTLCLPQEDIDADIKPRFRSSASWVFLELGENPDVNDASMEEITNIVRRSKDPVVKPKTPGAASSGRHASRGKRFDVQFYPASVRQHDETILMLFRHPLPDGQTVQISVDDQTAPKIDTQRINPYSFTFKAPAPPRILLTKDPDNESMRAHDILNTDHSQGKAHIYVFVDGSKRHRHTLRYPAPWIRAYTCPQFLCQLLGKEDETGLDQYLSSVYSASAAQDECLGHLLRPKNIIPNTGEKKSSDELPTLLHFACHYGLENLCKNIVELTPGVEHVFEICNCDDKTPIALAEDSGHQDIVDYLDSFQELVSYVSNFAELYESMDRLEAGGDLLTGGYIPMDQGYLIDRGYTEGRVGSNIDDDDYEIKHSRRGNPSGVSEVPEEEDVQELKPAVPARLPRTPQPTETSSPIQESKPPLVPRRIQHGAFPPITGASSESHQFLQGIEPISPSSMGSRTLEEVTQLQMAFKNGDLLKEDVVQFFEDWRTRVRSSGSSSMKERHDQLKDFMQSNEKIMTKVKPKGFFSRFSKSKKPQRPPLEIQHHVQPNQYDHWNTIGGGHTGCESTVSNFSTYAHAGSTRYTGRESTISNISTSSSSSSGSRDSALDPVIEYLSSSSDDELSQSQHRDYKPPPVISRTPGALSPPVTHAPPPPVAPARPPLTTQTRSRLPQPPKKTEFLTSSTPAVPPRPPKR